MKVGMTEEHSNMVLDGLILALTGNASPEWANSSTAEFKSRPFQNTAIIRNIISELIKW